MTVSAIEARGLAMTRWQRVSVAAIVGAGGCAGPRVELPAGSLPTPAAVADLQTAAALGGPVPPKPVVPPQIGKGKVFELPPALPGADVPPLAAPTLDKTATPAQRLAAVKKSFPELTPVVATASPDGPALSLANLQELAAVNSPVVRRAQADADVSYGQVVQAGLHPNPTVGYQSDQVQPSLRVPYPQTFSGAGQQGGYINQLIKTAGKLRLAQQVAGYDYINALVSVRRARFDVTAAVRSAYFNVLVARQGVEVNRALAQLADEVYRLQVSQVAVGEGVRYEPLQLVAQAYQARNALAQAEAAERAAWRQLAAAVGQPALPPAPLAGRADVPAPDYDADAARVKLLDAHTDILSARNAVAQAGVNLTFQRRQRIPDLLTNTYQQYDNAAQTYQFGLQIGVQLPISDRNQGNILSAQSQIGRAGQNLRVVENDLQARFAEAFGRYEANRVAAANYREVIIPNLGRAYRAIVRRYNVDEPGKVGFGDIVVAQGQLAAALQAYLTALSAQWQAVVDVANVAQLDDLYPAQPTPGPVEGPPAVEAVPVAPMPRPLPVAPAPVAPTR